MHGVETMQLSALSEKSRIPLRRYFQRRIRGKADADDMVQEVFLRLIRLAGHEKIDNIDGYVCRIAANLVRDYARRLSVRKCDIQIEDMEQMESLSAEGVFTPERILLGREAISQVISVLGELPEKTRTIFTLYHLEVISQVQIARTLGMPLSTVEKHMCKANAHLQSRLQQ
jgi:RNA polymerase sigma factor (sigma-70 family)